MYPKVLLMLEVVRSLDRGLIEGICEYSRQNGPWEFYLEPSTVIRPQEKKELLYREKKWGASGIIVRKPYQDISSILKLNLPTITDNPLKENLPHVGHVSANYDAVGKMAAEYFLKNGFKNFAYCGFNVPLFSQWAQKCFVQHLAELGFNAYIYDPPKFKGIYLWDKELTFMAEWLKSLPKPIAIMCCDDFRGSHVIESCRIANIKVPNEAAVLGVNNDILPCNLTFPHLSSIAFNYSNAGYAAAELLDRLMKGENVQNKEIVVQPTHVEERESTNILAVDDSLVAEALRFIHENANKKMVQVADVVNSVSVSRRRLEQRFRKALGRTIYDEIISTSIDGISRMLTYTNKPIKDILFSFGFPDSRAVARFFRKRTGMTPRAYREKYSIKSSNTD